MATVVPILMQDIYVCHAWNLLPTCDCVESDDKLSLVSGLLFGTDGGNLRFA